MTDDPWDALPDGVVIADGEGTVQLVNAVAARMLGPSARVGVHLSEAVALQDRAGHTWFDTNCPFDGLPSRTGIPEQPWFLADGTELLVTARLTRATRGGPVSRVGLVLRSARGRERLDRERSDLVATVAHELRSPLTGVKGFATTLLNRWDRLNDEQKLLMLTTVRADSDRLSRLITELLDVARLDTGRLSFYPREVAPLELLERVVASARAGTPSRELVLEAPDEVPAVFADPDKFVQVMTNLVDNAIRHGDGRVLVRVAAIQDPFAGVRLVVEDEGEGIPEGIRSRVFTKFWRHGVRGGSGLGMYIVHGLATVHGGTVTIGEATGGGAHIEVSWPTEDRRGESGSQPGRSTS